MHPLSNEHTSISYRWRVKKYCYLKSHVNNVKKEATKTPLVTHGESYNFEDSAGYTENDSLQISVNKEALVFLKEKTSDTSYTII